MTPEDKLMKDLIHLVHQYGSEPFERLAMILRSPEESAKLASVLDGALKISPASKNAKKARPRPVPGSQILNELRKDAPEKYELLEAVRSQLASGQMFRSIHDLRRFTEEYGVSLGSANSQSKAIVPMLRFLAPLSLQESQKILQMIALENSDDRSLARWSEVIMRRGSSESS